MNNYLNEPRIDWTEAHIELLKTMWAAGFPHSAIAARIPNATRSAIAGKIMRLKLPSPERKVSTHAPSGKTTPKISTAPAAAKVGQISKPASEITALPQSRPQTAALVAVNEVRRAERIARSPGLDELLEEPAVGKGLQMIELTNHTCRWPFGDPLTENFYFCGEPGADLQEKRPYCPFHSRKSVDRVRSRQSFEAGALFAAGIKTSTRGAQHGT